MQYVKFQSAKPVWEGGKEKEMNYNLTFGCKVPKADNSILRVTGSTIYVVKVNGTFVGTGPARTAHDFYRVDELDISGYLTKEENILTVDVAGYNSNGYYLLDQPSFLCAEVISDGTVIAATGDNGFVAVYNQKRLRKVQRYSFQRQFSEVYDLDNNYDAFETALTGDYVTLVETEEKKYIPRNIFYPDYTPIYPSKIISEGLITVTEKAEYKYDRCVTKISDVIKGFPMEELEIISTKEIQKLDCEETCNDVAYSSSVNLEKNKYVMYEMPNEVTGSISLSIECFDDITLYISFDEVLSDKKIDPTRMQCCNVVIWKLKKGTYNISTFEPYSLKYLQVSVLGGACKIDNLHIKSYSFPEIKKEIVTDNPKLKAIYDAAVQSFRQNTFDIYMDCPSRERAGWLCDSFFTSRVEYVLTGKSSVERNFLENFIIVDKFKDIPDGMLPMCYPAEHPNHQFIPNWAMWFVLELKEYLARTNDRKFIDECKDKMYNLLHYFDKFVNEYGLLEDLESWVFIEWSFANNLTYGINFPSNMLFVSMLNAMADMYNDNSLKQRAEQMTKTIKKMSFNGQFFHDNAYREDNKIHINREITEVCQYYAFFTGIATPEEYPELWNILLNDFGPERKDTGKWPDIHFANAFIGNYLRLELLLLNGYTQKLLENIEGYFYYMAEKTGTLWELIGETASCNHGFASHVIYWFDKMGMLK